jgi:hypothetical protein
MEVEGANLYSLRSELDGPQAALPIKHNICKTPLSKLFLLPRGPKSKSGTTGPGLAPEQGSRAGAGHAPELGTRPHWPAAAAPLAEEAVPSRSGGEAKLPRRPSPALPLPRERLSLRRCPELPPAALVLRSPSEGSNAGAPLSVEVLRAGAPLARRLHQSWTVWCVLALCLCATPPPLLHQI